MVVKDGEAATIATGRPRKYVLSGPTELFRRAVTIESEIEASRAIEESTTPDEI
ncbi:hypothetical protein MBEHAL_1341 [Halarchaeum acidiphilum MH1-52-1]|uniref:Uncharacterized protein n=1 Tax=Halarchaeum acidiphilum MH1-52-1 TaxID=1261545 RepID=U2YF49_9EURY|nr:hypothetical protein MBEHAL_1341 [Halarchaeum acidiphilum MH1-52-1]